eukprot:Nk52_evm47s2309 gene=Nk52_evmTU47s2309
MTAYSTISKKPLISGSVCSSERRGSTDSMATKGDDFTKVVFVNRKSKSGLSSSGGDPEKKMNKKKKQANTVTVGNAEKNLKYVRARAGSLEARSKRSGTKKSSQKQVAEPKLEEKKSSQPKKQSLLVRFFNSFSLLKDISDFNRKFGKKEKKRPRGIPSNAVMTEGANGDVSYFTLTCERPTKPKQKKHSNF